MQMKMATLLNVTKTFRLKKTGKYGGSRFMSPSFGRYGLSWYMCAGHNCCYPCSLSQTLGTWSSFTIVECRWP